MSTETVRVKHSDDLGNEFLVINKSDFDPSKHEPFDDESRDAVKDKMNEDGDRELSIAEADDERRRYEANRGITGGPALNSDGRNPSGTFSEPTPSDIRYPNKDETEFENNHGAFVNKSAAQMRDEKGLPDAPGGLAPQAKHVGKGPRGKWYVKHGTERLAGPFDSEDEAKSEMESDQVNDAEQSIEQESEQRSGAAPANREPAKAAQDVKPAAPPSAPLGGAAPAPVKPASPPATGA